jgi:acetamidase/formamidase
MPHDSRIGVHHVCSSSIHSVWDNTIEPACEVSSGDSIELSAPDASYRQIGRAATADDLGAVDFSLMNPLAGPVFVRDAHPGDTLEVEILRVETDTWGWTGIVPGFGLLAEDFPRPWLRVSEIEHGRVCFADGVEIQCRPFPGTIGVAPDRPGAHSVIPPSEFGGNLDVRYLTVGTRLFLPVGVEGALFSVGDGHAAQGDGEVCGSAIETAMRISVRLTARPDLRIAAPQLMVPAPALRPSESVYVTTGVAGDLREAAQDAVRAMIDHLGRRHRMDPEEAYALTSVAGELRINEVVNAPMWVVSAALPDMIFHAP